MRSEPVWGAAIIALKAYRAAAKQGGGPLLQQEATGSRRETTTKEAEIPTDDEPTGHHSQGTNANHLNGPALGDKPDRPPHSAARRHFRRLVNSASDELTRYAIKAATSGVLTLIAYWIHHH
ncbi:hypothetical protein [Streptomyces violascens]|uniref:hypothetical protein n=1 Tax=Streptomyces violascens TaxID=67381 RepID=UPI0036CDDAA4